MTGVGLLVVGVCRVFGLLGMVVVPVFSFAWFVGAEAAWAVASLVPLAVGCVKIALVVVALWVGALRYARLGGTWSAAGGVGLVLSRVPCCVGERLSDEEGS